MNQNQLDRIEQKLDFIIEAIKSKQGNSKQKSPTKRKVAKPLISEEEETVVKHYFMSFHGIYPGVKRKASTEYENFKKKHKDFHLVAPKLYSVIQDQKEGRKLIEESGSFVPEWKHMQTYLNQRAWEVQYKVDEEKVNKVNKENKQYYEGL